MKKQPKYEYDIALSFAGENRDFVEIVADILTSLKLKVFYDNYEKHKLLGKNLYSYLADIYHNKAKYAVVFVSEYYKQKLWTSHELTYITTREFEQKGEYLLPIKLDNTYIEEIPSTIGYLEGDTPLNVALTIAKKVDPTLDVKLMLDELYDLLPSYNIKIEGNLVLFNCPSESFEVAYPLSLMMELYNCNLIEPLFVGASIVPN